MRRSIAVRPVFTFAGDLAFCAVLVRKLAAAMISGQEGNANLSEALEDEALAVHGEFSGEEYQAVSEVLLSLWLEKEGEKNRRLFHVSNQASQRNCQTSRTCHLTVATVIRA